MSKYHHIVYQIVENNELNNFGNGFGDFRKSPAEIWRQDQTIDLLFNRKCQFLLVFFRPNMLYSTSNDGKWITGQLSK